MIQTRARSALVSAAIFIGAMLGAYGQAQAAIYRGSWDPAFGAPFDSLGNNLGWKGSATFLVPDACLSSSGWIDNTLTGCAAGGMKVLGATVNFYNASTDPFGVHILETLTFSNPVAQVYSMQITANQLAGVSSGFSNSLLANNPLAGNGTDYFGLKFFHSTTYGNGASLFYTQGYQDPSCAYPATSECGHSNTTPNVTYALVPEPATVALVLAGLAAIGLVARRRRR